MHAGYRTKAKPYYECMRHRKSRGSSRLLRPEGRGDRRPGGPAGPPGPGAGGPGAEPEGDRRTSTRTASASTATGSSGWSGRATRRNAPSGSTRRSSRRTAWWPARWSGAGRRRCGINAQLEDEYDRFLQEQPPQLSEDERARIRALASDIPALWDAPGTTAADRKEVIRLLVERVVVSVREDSEHVDMEIHWRGGFTSRHEILRPVRLYSQLRDHDRLMDLVAEWRRAGRTSAQIAAGLNREGFRTPTRRRRLHAGSGAKLWSSLWPG